MAAENNFRTTVESLFKGMDSFITTKTVVGEAITVGDTIILPLVDVSFGVGAGAFAEEKKNNGGGAMGGKISPSAVLVISGGVTKLVNIKNQDGLTKVLDMVPDFLNKFTEGKKESEVVIHTEEKKRKKQKTKPRKQGKQNRKEAALHILIGKRQRRAEHEPCMWIVSVCIRNGTVYCFDFSQDALHGGCGSFVPADRVQSVLQLPFLKQTKNRPCLFDKVCQCVNQY